MIRGQQVLEKLIPTAVETVGQKGQRNALLEERNIKITHRYYYYAHLWRLRYDDVLQNLMHEFDLTPNTVWNILKDKTDLIAELEAQKTDCSDLAKKYPFFVWKVARVA